MTDVVVYSATGCPLCAEYKALLAEKGIRYRERNQTDQPGPTATVPVGETFAAGSRPDSLLDLLPT